jgi:hypothetical protein
MKINSIQLRTILFVFIISLLSACGSGGSSPSKAPDNTPGSNGNDDNNEGNNRGIAGINGLITLDEWDNLFDKNLGVISFQLLNGQVASRAKKVVSGRFPHRHKNGKLLYNKGCGNSINYIIMLDKDYNKTELTPCSDKVTTSAPSGKGYYTKKFEYSRLSPDGTKVAVDFREHSYESSLADVYTTIIYDLNKNELVRHTGYASASWLPDGRLLMLGWLGGKNGIFITDNNLNNPTRINDHGKIKSFLNNSDISPNGRQVVFEKDQQIWIMNLDGKTAPKPLIVEGSHLKFPTWSPGGKYIAYLKIGSVHGGYHGAVFFYDVVTKESYSLPTEDFLAPNEYKTYEDISGPMSWIK